MDLSELEQSLRKTLWLNKATLACLCQVILGLINDRTTDLAQLAAALQRTAKLASKQRRIKKLLKRWPTTIDWLGPWLVGWFYAQDEKVSLTMDRTNWKIEQININFLVIGVVYRRAAIPLLFVLLPEFRSNPYSKTRALSGTISDIDDYDLLVH